MRRISIAGVPADYSWHDSYAKVNCMPVGSMATIQLLEWITERSRSYPETIEVWKSSCPRLTVWEDALADGLVCVSGARVLLTQAGLDCLGTASS